MLQKSVNVIIIVLITVSWTKAQSIVTPDGYAGYVGTTGGGNATAITVSTASEFKSAIAGSTPTVIIVKGRLNVGSVTIGSNKTIVGADSNSGLYGGTIKVQGTNYIFQDLKFGPASGDVMEISGGTKVFIRNCEFFDSSDELCSIVREADYVTVSWCKFYFSSQGSHNFAHLIGNSDDRTTDRGKLHVTLHHNWYAENVRGRMPRVRYGYVHIYNNYYNSVGNGYCIGVGYECHIRLENTYFENINAAWADYGGVSNGQMGWHNLKFINCSQPTFVSNSFPVFEPPYEFTLDSVENVKSIVTANSGQVTSIERSKETIQSEFSLSQNYPNPFNPSTNIEFQIPQSGHVTITVYNMLGESVETLIDKDMNIGTYTVNFDGSNFCSGIYIYQMKSGSYMKSKKFVLLK